MFIVVFLFAGNGVLFFSSCAYAQEGISVIYYFVLMLVWVTVKGNLEWDAHPKHLRIPSETSGGRVTHSAHLVFIKTSVFL